MAATRSMLEEKDVFKETRTKKREGKKAQTDLAKISYRISLSDASNYPNIPGLDEDTRRSIDQILIALKKLCRRANSGPKFHFIISTISFLLPLNRSVASSLEQNPSLLDRLKEYIFYPRYHTSILQFAHKPQLRWCSQHDSLLLYISYPQLDQYFLDHHDPFFESSDLKPAVYRLSVMRYRRYQTFESHPVSCPDPAGYFEEALRTYSSSDPKTDCTTPIAKGEISSRSVPVDYGLVISARQEAKKALQRERKQKARIAQKAQHLASHDDL